MNASLLNIVKSIVTNQGEGILSEPRRISAFFSDLAKDEPKPQKNAFVKCLEHRFAQILKTASEQDRPLCKQKLAQRLHDEEGLDPALCADTLELLATVLFGEQQQVIKTNQVLSSAVKNTPLVKSTRGAVKKNDLKSLKVLSIIGLFFPFLLLFLTIMQLELGLIDLSDFIMAVITTIFYFGFNIAHFSLALVKGKKYNLEAIKVMAIIGILLNVFTFLLITIISTSTYVYDTYVYNDDFLGGFLIGMIYETVFSIVALVQIRNATKENQTPYTPTE
jgi:cation transport ATPase